MALLSPTGGVVLDAAACSVAKTANRLRLRERRPIGSWCVGTGNVRWNTDELRGASVEFLGAERFGQEVICAELHGARVLLLLPGCRENDARQVAPSLIAAHGREDVEATEVRHHQVEQYEADVGFAFEGFDRFTSIVGECDVKRTLLELHFDDAAD